MVTAQYDFFKNKGNWYKGNLHTHTTHSDGDLSPKEMAARYRDKGYDFLAITDHDRCPEGTEWERWLATVPLLLIPGVECSVPAHILNHSCPKQS